MVFEVMQSIVPSIRYTETDPKIIERAIYQQKTRNQDYETYHAYYEGNQPLTFASEKYEESFAKMVSKYSENMCPAVVDSIADRLDILGFQTFPENENLSNLVWNMWKRNRMDERIGHIHTECLKAGDAYVIVWPDIFDPSWVRFWPQDANSTTVHYDEETLEIDWAAKYWIQESDRKGRLTLYFDNRIERWITKEEVRGTWPDKADKYDRFDAPQFHPYGRVPVFHFANNARIGMWGRSELHNVLPIQDALNKAVSDMLVGMEFMAFPQRWATGLQVKLDDTGKPVQPWKPGVDRIWSTGNDEANFGQFPSAELDQMLKVQERFKGAMADVSGTPAHYMQMSWGGNWPSGESLKTSESRFIAKIEDRQVSFGNVWEDIVEFSLNIMGLSTSLESGGVDVEAQWKSASPRSEVESLNMAATKRLIGIPDAQIQRELGYTEEEITNMAREKDEQNRASLMRQQQLMNSGRTEFDTDESVSL